MIFQEYILVYTFGVISTLIGIKFSKWVTKDKSKIFN